MKPAWTVELRLADSIPALENLVRTGGLKREEPARSEIEGLIKLGERRFKDAMNPDISFESRFDLAYNAAHSFSLAALRCHGYRSENRYLVFQTLAHTLKLPNAKWRVLAKAHDIRNIAEYEGDLDTDEQLLADLVSVAEEARLAVTTLTKSIPNT